MSLSLVPAGSVIERTYFAVPQHYGIGNEYDTFISAVRGALTLRDETYAAVLSNYPPGWEGAEAAAQTAADVKAVVDLRWVITYSDGSGGTDAVIERQNVAHLTFEHCDRMEAIHAQR